MIRLCFCLEKLHQPWQKCWLVTKGDKVGNFWQNVTNMMTFKNGSQNILLMSMRYFCLERPLCGEGNDIMQIKKGKWVTGFYFPTTHYHNKMLIIKLGTIVHLKTCVMWLISLCWLSDHHRSKFLWKCYRTAVFLLPRRSSTPHRLSVLRKVESLQSFWRRWSSKSWQSRRNTPSGRSRSVSTFFRWYVHLVFGRAHLALTNAALDEEWLGESRHIGSLLPGFV